MLQLLIMEDVTIVATEKTRNPATKATFRRQVWLQIYLPFAVGLALLAVIAWLLWDGGLASASAWADASLIMLLVPVIILSVIPIALVVALIYGVTYLIGQIPVPAHQVQQSLAQVERLTKRFTKQAATPMIAFKSSVAAARAVARELKNKYRRMG